MADRIRQAVRQRLGEDALKQLNPAIDRVAAFGEGRTDHLHVDADELSGLTDTNLGMVKGVRLGDGELVVKTEADLPLIGRTSVDVPVSIKTTPEGGVKLDAGPLGELAGIDKYSQRLDALLRARGGRIESVRITPEGIDVTAAPGGA